MNERNVLPDFSVTAIANGCHEIFIFDESHRSGGRRNFAFRTQAMFPSAV
tara:strand:+ start:236147 stop:236296 length:150 start_codon:yes stop_codon:yes gene_type:complete